MATKIEVRNLKISFWTNNGSVRAVRDISFKVEEGKTLAIVGESGSGKSVTAKAMLGILAGNSIIEGGEIFYNGMDLMKVKEEDFHHIRGNNIAMIFQDPLSSLNPIMRIGRQLTEAMIANNRASRAQSRQNYNNYTKAVEEHMLASGTPSDKTKDMVSRFHKLIKEGNHLENTYNVARDTAETTVSNIAGLKISIINGLPREILPQIKRLIQYAKRCANPFLIPEDDADFNAAIETLNTERDKYRAAKGSEESKVGLNKAFDELSAVLEKGLARPKPRFMALGLYSIQNGRNALYGREIEKLNSESVQLLDDAFNAEFKPLLQKAIIHADKENDENKIKALAEINDALNKLKGNIDISTAKDVAKNLKPYISDSINKLETEKDSICYTFANAIDNAVKIYDIALRSEGKSPKKKARMRKADKLPEELDLELLQTNIRLVIERVKESFEKPRNPLTGEEAMDKATELIEAMDYESSRMDYKLSGALAKTRAIDLMEEVGIPQARQRFRQYPFEFSGGMRQRIVIAIALASNPDVLICDEPTTALDVTIQAQILDLINELKRERNLSIVFITHDLGVVANMADDIAVMYAGKIVEKGSADEVFYEAAHPYTWALLSSMPDLDTKEKLEYIPGVPPNMIFPPKGDAFAQRNKYAMAIDFEEQPPMFKITETHSAATWLLHPDAPKVEPPAIVTDRIKRMKAKWGGKANE